MAVYNEEFLSRLPNDPKFALHEICAKYQQHAGSGLDPALEFYALVEAFSEAHGLDINLPELPLDREEKVKVVKKLMQEIVASLREYLRLKTDVRKLENHRAAFAKRLSGIFAYEFSDGDLRRIQSLLNELRDLLGASDMFDEKHKRRLLKRLESLQAELHKRMSDLDHFWGLVGDAGVALGKFGREAKPFVDRIREITGIVWRTQARAEELPSGTEPPALTAGDNQS